MHFKLCIVNKITSTYPATKKIHRELKRILKQFKRRKQTLSINLQTMEQYELLEIGNTQIIYELTDFPQSFPIIFVCDVQNLWTARLNIAGGSFEGMDNDFTPKIMRWCLDG